MEKKVSNMSIASNELLKIKKAKITSYNETDNSYFIPQLKQIKIEPNHTYLIYLKDTLFNDQVLKINWNKGNMPKKQFLYIEILQMIGAYIQVNSVAYDTQNNVVDGSYTWSGWLNMNNIDFISRFE